MNGFPVAIIHMYNQVHQYRNSNKFSLTFAITLCINLKNHNLKTTQDPHNNKAEVSSNHFKKIHLKCNKCS